MALADVYDAIRSQRCYKKPLCHEKAVAIISAESGKHFDPDLVTVFERIQNQFRAISTTFTD
jgi:putative two-component system response regulator